MYKLKTFFNSNKTKQTYNNAKPYVVIGAHFVWALLFGTTAYILDALNNFRIRARKEPFIVLAALATIIYAVFAYNQWQVMRGQLDEMQEARRPWIQGDIRFIGPLVFDQGGARVPIILSLANSGRSPAKNVWRGARLFAGDGPDDLISGWEDTVCKGIIRDAQKGFTIFPNETPGNPFPVGVSASDVKNNVNLDGEIILRIIACIDYTFAFSREHHQTSYIWEIDKSNAATGFTHLRPSDGAVQPNDLLKLTDPSLPGRAN